jgi:hypothetical protein
MAPRRGDKLGAMAASTSSSSKPFASSGKVSVSGGNVFSSSGKVKDPAQTTTHFFALPAELQVWIVEYLVSSSDKRNLSLVCKHMQALMMPCIYRHMTLHPLQLNELLRSVFSSKHPGLPYIQTLRIQGNTYGAETPNLMPVLCRLLKSIPKDTLRVFE